MSKTRVIPFVEYCTESFQKFLQEKLLIINQGARYGQAIIMAGGSGSGKGYAIANMIDGSRFKVRDVDEIKKGLLRIANLKNKYPEIRDSDLRNPDDVFKLHAFVKAKGLDSKSLNNVLGLESPNRQKNNVIIDTTAKSMSDLNEIIDTLHRAGYRRQNIHVIWVLTNYKIAIERNKKRNRVVPDDILIQTHSGAANTMFNLISGRVPQQLHGGIYVIFGNPETQVFWKDAEGRDTNVIKDFKYITIKEPGSPVKSANEFQRNLFNWIVDNIPQNFMTQGIFDAAKKLSSV